MPSHPRSSASAASSPLKLDLARTYYKARHPRSRSDPIRVSGAGSGLRAWHTLPMKESTQGETRFKISDRVEAYWMDDEDTPQSCAALIIEIREVRWDRNIRKKHKSVPKLCKEPVTLLMVAWFYEPAFAATIGAHVTAPTVSSHIDIISIECVRERVRPGKRIAINAVLITHAKSVIPANTVDWLPRQRQGPPTPVAVPVTQGSSNHDTMEETVDVPPVDNPDTTLVTTDKMDDIQNLLTEVRDEVATPQHDTVAPHDTVYIPSDVMVNPTPLPPVDIVLSADT
ncbi:uncharacterized protein Z519_12141 [Cladophialophora bantiana CBS 173.52]|uniref:Uncharacterized protein n=1 Tax=Cladophialophora bantiana (strain ATCC 10958 / CBS 173.52 / CDC B-1940 / NIH 8579) TaxID=1442370 RepID=A0A0D2H1S8_CLAB1|nr:uncharacterized protein Z519_12141 [Cladophialophora bantiana CBS 173.52]KIW87238.1 hypothetical protein Z519_12141 [Cladophialophora bantiana CBS 173.52]